MFEQNEPTNKSNNNQCNSIWGASDNHCDNPAILNDKLPKVKNHTTFHNPDSYTLKKALIIRYAGKAIGWYKYWLNIKKHWHQRTCKHRLEQSKGMQISWRRNSWKYKYWIKWNTNFRGKIREVENLKNQCLQGNWELSAEHYL